MENNLELFSRGMTAAYDDELYKICEYFYGVDAAGQSRLLPPATAMRKRDDFRETYRAYQSGGVAGAIQHTLSRYERSLSTFDATPRLARYTDNHDEGRGAYRYGDSAVKAFNELIVLLPHCIPFILTGQEFGALNRPSIHERVRPCDKGRRVQRGRTITYEEGVEFEGNLFARGHDMRQDWYTFYQKSFAYV